MINVKQQMKSKTVKFMALFGVAQVLNESLAQAGFITPEVSALVTQWIAAITPIAGILLRQITTTAIADK